MSYLAYAVTATPALPLCEHETHKEPRPYSLCHHHPSPSLSDPDASNLALNGTNRN